MKTFKLILNWIIPVFCIINIAVYWENTTMAMAWLVATTGWISNLINYYKYEV